MRHEQAPEYLNDRSPHDAPERRADDRTLTVYRTARVERADDAGLWRVRNMSDRGMLLETGAIVLPDEKLTVALSETVIVAGRVAWASEGRCGIAFDEAISVSDVLRQLVAEQESKSFRPLRLQVRCSARLLVDAEPIEIMVNTISQLGVGFAYEGDLQEEAQVGLMLADNIWRRGNIRWVREGKVGLRLASPFALSELESVSRFRSA